MSLLFRVLFASRCTSNHHRLALDALRHLRGPDAEMWRNLFLKHNDLYLEGSKAPDVSFKDFKNHVLHVRDGYWGGAVGAAREWYASLNKALRDGRWPDAVYAAGVLSHYVTDPCQPCHTGQTEEEGNIHRAFEWSLSKTYGELQSILENDLGGYPALELPDEEDWLAVQIRRGAEAANQHYELVIDHYDLDKGVKDPRAGLDQELKDTMAALVGHAAVSYARVLERALAEAAVTPPHVEITLQGYLESLTIPLRWVTRKLDDARDRALVEATWREVKQTGRVRRMLSEDDRAVRKQHAEEVLGKTVEELEKQPVRATGLFHGNGARPRKRSSLTRSGTPRVRPAAPHPMPAEAPKPTSTPQPVTTPKPGVATAPEAPQREVPAPVRRTTSTEPKPQAAPLPSFEPRWGAPAKPAPAPILAKRAVAEPAKPPRPQLTEPAPFTVAGQNEQTADLGDRPVATPAPPSTMQAGAWSPPVTQDRDPPARASHRRFRALQPGDDVVDAPSIGPKTAARLNKIGVHTVQDLLALEANATAARLKVGYITAETVRDWQAQATLAVSVPELRGHDTQILVACGVRSVISLAAQDPEALLRAALDFAATSAGERIVRPGNEPDITEVRAWIAAAEAIAATAPPPTGQRAA